MFKHLISSTRYFKKGAFLVALVLVAVPFIFLASVQDVSASNLYVNISADPYIGPAPLNNVDFTATVSGTATGDITYRFDCTNDGSWEKTITTSNTTFTAVDLCSYSNVGSYTAAVKAERDNLSFKGTIAIVVQSPVTLSVALSANPSSGPAPLNNVDLTATVSGTATGGINYKFDCTNNGSWDHTFYDISDNPKTVYDACDYPSSGDYTAKVYVERGSASPAQATTQINVSYYSPPPTLDLRVNNSNGPITIDYNSSALLSWNSTNTTSCQASGSWSGAKTTNGSQSTGNLTSSNTYYLNCSGPGGSVSDSVVVNVDSCVNNPPNADAGPDKEVFENESVVLRGSGSDPDSDPITYSWSCAEGWLSSYNVAQPTYNAPSVDYDRNYTCTLTVRDDNGASDSDSMRVKVINREEENPNLTISKLVRNLTSSSGWQSSMSVNPSDRLEFSIRVSSSGSTTVNGVRIKDILPSKINYQGNLKINDSSSSADIFDSLYLGALYSGQSKNITFRAQVAPESEFRAGDTTQLVNIARTWADGVGQKEDRVTLSVHCPNVLPPVSTDVSIKKLVRNMSDGTGWVSSVLADPDEIVSFSIEVSNNGSNVARNITVRDTLPNKISFQNDLKIDDISSGGDIMSGLSIGDLSPGQSKKITFKGMVAPKSQFGVGNTDLINAVVAFNQDLAVSASAKVIVSKTAPTEVITGLTNNKFLDYILLPLLAAFAMIFISKKYFVVFSEKWEKWLDEKKKQITEQKSKRILGRKIARIKTRESY